VRLTYCLKEYFEIIMRLEKLSLIERVEDREVTLEEFLSPAQVSSEWV
jgi:hypothetical protein